MVLAERGMARTFQLVQIFPQLTVAETIAAAVVIAQGKQWRLFSRCCPAMPRSTRASRRSPASSAWSAGCDTVSRLLSQGEKKLLDVASAFALEPEVILLDEPTSGVSTAEKHGVMKTLIGAAKAAGVKAIILVEHDMDLVAAYSHRIIALSEGQGAGGPAARGRSSPIRSSSRPWSASAGDTRCSSVDDLVVDIEGSHILRGVSLEVAAGELVCLVGRNGAGKSTTFRTIMGQRKPVSGAIALEGRSHRRACAPSRSPGWASASRRRKARCSATSPWPRTSCCRPGRGQTERSAAEREALAYRVFPKLERYRARGGQQLRAASARWCRSPARWRSIPSCCCSTSRPRACRRPSCRRSSRASPRSAQLGHAVLIAESNLHHVPDFADRLYVIERGEIIFAGPPADARKDPAVAKIVDGAG